VRRFYLSIVAFLVLAISSPVHAQGCSQCRDNVKQTPPHVQAAYRHAIVLLGGVAAMIFTGTLIIIKRNS